MKYIRQHHIDLARSHINRFSCTVMGQGIAADCRIPESKAYLLVDEDIADLKSRFILKYIVVDSPEYDEAMRASAFLSYVSIVRDHDDDADTRKLWLDFLSEHLRSIGHDS